MEESFLDVQNGKAIIHIEGMACIDNVAKLHQIFQDALESQLPVMLDMKNVIEIDSSFIQLIRSMCYTLNKGGHSSLELVENTLPEVIKDLVNITGFKFNISCTKMDNVDCFCKKIAIPVGQ